MLSIGGKHERNRALSYISTHTNSNACDTHTHAHAQTYALHGHTRIMSRPWLGQMLLSQIGQMSHIQKVSVSTLALNTILEHLGISQFLPEKLN